MSPSSSTNTGSTEDRRRRGAGRPRWSARPLHRDRPHHPHQPDATSALGAQRGRRPGGPGRGDDGGGRARLCQGFDVDASKVDTIAHGAAVPARRVVPDPRDAPTILTWGLIGPGKGIERVIEAMRTLHDLPCPRVTWWPAGPTPRCWPRKGTRTAGPGWSKRRHLGVSSSVVFDADYRDVSSLTSADPVERGGRAALRLQGPGDVRRSRRRHRCRPAGGRHGISHAIELLASGAGIVVEHDDPDALAWALRLVLTRPDRAAAMAAEAPASPRAWAGRWSPASTCDLADRLLAGDAASAGMSRPVGTRSPRFRHLSACPTSAPPSSMPSSTIPDPSTATAPTTWRASWS